MTWKKSINTATFLYTGIVPLQHLKQHIFRQPLTRHTFYKMTDPTIMLDEGEVVRMVNKEGDPKIFKIMKAWDSKGNPEEESNSDFDYYAELSDEELSPGNKIQYNEWFDFHSKYQRNTGIGGTISQIIHGISNQNKP